MSRHHPSRQPDRSTRSARSIRSIRTPLRRLLLAGLGLALVVPATAGASAPDATATKTVQHGTSVITLITGDRVDVTQQNPGHISVTVDLSDRSADRANPGFSKHEEAGHVYVVPADVASLVPGTLDWSLFDVTALAAAGLDDASSATLPVTITTTADANVSLPATTAVAGLSGAYAVTKSHAADLGAALASAAKTGAGLAGIEHITLTGVSAGPIASTSSAGVDRPTSTLTVEATAPDGRPAGGISGIDILNIDDQSIYQQISLPLTAGTLSVTVPDGNYAVMGYLFTYDEPSVYAIAGAAVFDPQVAVNGDTTVVLDGTKAAPVNVATDDPVEPTGLVLDYYRSDAIGQGYSHSFLLGAPITKMYAAPTADVTIGQFEFYTQHSLIAPDVTVSVTDPVQEPVDTDYVWYSSKFDGAVDNELVYAGLGRTQDFDGIDVNGKIALIQRGEITFLEKIQNAQDAGASMVMIYNNVPGVLLISGDPSLIPAFAMMQDQGEKLKGYLDDGPVTLHLDGVENSPYVYDLVFLESPIPGTLDYTVDASNTASLKVRYRADEKPHPAGELRHKWLPWEFSSFGSLRMMQTPIKRNEYVSTGPINWAQYYYAYSTPELPFESPMYSAPAQVQPGPQGIDSWKKQTIITGTPFDGVSIDYAAFRTGDSLVLNIPEWVDGQGHWGWATATDTTAFRLYQDDEQIASGAHAAGTFAMSPDDATYRVEVDASRSYDWWTYSADTSTVWTFPSSHTDGRVVVPLLNLQVKKKLTLQNKARDKHRDVLKWVVTHQTGAAGADITGSTLAVSYDGGSTWADADVTAKGNGKFRAVLPAPPDGATSVSLQFSATDSAGNAVEQVITPAYGLR